MRYLLALIISLAWHFHGIDAFSGFVRRTPSSSSTHRQSLKMVNPVLNYFPQVHFADGLVDAIKYRDHCPPEICLEQLVASALRSTVPLEAIHWFHPLIFSVAMLSLGLVGLKYGVDIKKFRQKRGVTQADYKIARDRHPLLMGILLFAAILGTQSGLASTLTLQVPLIDSWHSVSAVALTGGLAGQALTGNLLASNGRNDVLRKAHLIFGMGSMTILFAHIATGLQLAFSIDTSTLQ